METNCKGAITCLTTARCLPPPGPGGQAGAVTCSPRRELSEEVALRGSAASQQRDKSSLSPPSRMGSREAFCCPQVGFPLAESTKKAEGSKELLWAMGQLPGTYSRVDKSGSGPDGANRITDRRCE